MASSLHKILVVGDAGSGKATLVQSYLTSIGSMSDSKQIRIIQINLSGLTLRANIYNTSGLEKQDSERYIHYIDADVVILCFPVDSHQAFGDIETKWSPELQQNCPLGQIVLLGTKSDLRRKNPNFHYVTLTDGLTMSQKIGAYAYLECAAINNSGVWPIFQIVGQAIADKMKDNIDGSTYMEPISPVHQTDWSVSQTSGEVTANSSRQGNAEDSEDMEVLPKCQAQHKPIADKSRLESGKEVINKQKEKKINCTVS